MILTLKFAPKNKLRWQKLKYEMKLSEDTRDVLKTSIAGFRCEFIKSRLILRQRAGIRICMVKSGEIAKYTTL